MILFGRGGSYCYFQPLDERKSFSARKLGDPPTVNSLPRLDYYGHGKLHEIIDQTKKNVFVVRCDILLNLWKIFF